MKSRRQFLLILLMSCVFSGAVGYWFGFREALYFGIAADYLPRGSIATAHLEAIRTGKTKNTITMLEFDVDQGLLYGHDLFHHPLRSYLGPLWGFDFYPEYEQYAARLAKYRKTHPSEMKPDMFDTAPKDKEQFADEYKELAQSTRDNILKIEYMVNRYAP